MAPSDGLNSGLTRLCLLLVDLRIRLGNHFGKCLGVAFARYVSEVARGRVIGWIAVMRICQHPGFRSSGWIVPESRSLTGGGTTCASIRTGKKVLEARPMMIGRRR